MIGSDQYRRRSSRASVPRARTSRCGSLEPELARRLVLAPDEFFITLEARAAAGNVRVEGPVELDRRSARPVEAADISGCF